MNHLSEDSAIPSFVQFSRPAGNKQKISLTDDRNSALNKRLNEALFISRFSGAVSATLDPDGVCAIAARVLYEHIPYLSIVFSLPSLLGGKTIIFSPAGRNEECSPLLLNMAHEGSRDGENQTKALRASALRNGGIQCLRSTFDLSDGMGQIETFFEQRFIPRLSDKLSTAVTETFAQSLKNALEYSKVKEFAMRDGLTGLFNRRVFDEVFADHKEHCKVTPLSLLLIDIDDFKKVNDTFGHPAGDQVLVSFAKMLQQGCRGADLVARYGGEEFVVVLSATSASAYEIAQRLRSRFASTTFVFEDRQLRLTASIGISSTSDAQGKISDDLIHRADQSLYRAKKSGKNRTCIFPSRPVACFGQESKGQVGAPAGFRPDALKKPHKRHEEGAPLIIPMCDRSVS